MAILAHVTHSLIAGRTLAPVEPSEAMSTLELGVLNAGCVFFGVAILSTLFFGRFFCGWGCHIVALQDLCAALLRRTGIRPRPFRSRLLAFVPFLVAFYMFAWPSVRRWWLADAHPAFPGWTAAWTTTEFWRTFPGPVVAIATVLISGFLAVLFLGSKGFCTYACPYGAVFGLVDRVAATRIVVSPACNSCGLCSAACTSNVNVAREVNVFGMVVDPGCFKCLDCVDACPTEALRVARVPPWTRLRALWRRRVPRTYDFSWPEEILLASICLGTVLAIRGLYDVIPLLLSVGLGVISSYAAWIAYRVLRGRDTAVQRLALVRGGRRTRSGTVAIGVASVWFAFVAHSGLVQWHRSRGLTLIDRTGVSAAELLAVPGLIASPGAADRALLRDAERHLRAAEGLGLVSTPDIELGLAFVDLVAGRVESADRRLAALLEQHSDSPSLYDHRIAVLQWGGRNGAAFDLLERKTGRHAATPRDQMTRIELLTSMGRRAEARAAVEALLAHQPESVAVREFARRFAVRSSK